MLTSTIPINPNTVEKALHERALQIAQAHGRSEADLLDILQLIDDKKVFRAYGYPSLFQYAVSALKLSEASAYNFITVARKAREIPILKEEIQAGNLSVATVRKITTVVTPINAPQWIEKAKTLAKFQLEKEVATLNPQIFTPERAKYVSSDRIAMQFGIAEWLFQKMQKAKDILSQKNQAPVSTENMLAVVVEFFLDHHDPIRRAQKQSEKKPVLGQVNDASKGPTIPAATRRQLHLRDQHQCTFIQPNGKRCDQTRWLDVHHIVAKQKGGDHTLENLQTLCFHHHRLAHGRN